MEGREGMLESPKSMIGRRRENTLPIGPVCVALFFLVALCAQPVWSAAPAPTSSASQVHLEGEGSSSLFPLLDVWAREYRRLHPEVLVTYKSFGAKLGVKDLLSRSPQSVNGNKVLFAVTEVPLTNKQLPLTDEERALAERQILQFPVTLQAVVPIYNLPQFSKLRFSGTTLADIFLGKIPKWNDVALARDNPGVVLPEIDIQLRHRFPPSSIIGSGSFDTSVMAAYLSKVSPDFKAALDRSATDWPIAISNSRWDDGRLIANTPGAMGYFWGPQSDVQSGALRNRAGQFVTASPEAVTAASAAAVSSFSANVPNQVSITDPPGETAYPLASFIWIVFYKHPEDMQKQKTMINFLKWILTDGQTLARKHGYAPLADDLVKIELQSLNQFEKENK